MTDETEETVADTSNDQTETADAVASDDAGQSAQVDEPDLNDLLAEFDGVAGDDGSTKADNTDTKAGDTQDVVNERVQQEVEKALAKREAEERARADELTFAKAVKGDVEMDDDVVLAWLNKQAEKDPRLSKAWVNRDKSPKEWGKVQGQLAKNFQKLFQPVDENATDSVEAAMAAVSSASSSSSDADEAPNFGSMSDAEFNRHAAKYGITV